MKNHSMVFEDFFADPRRAKALIAAQEISDVKYDDGVVYPNIALLPASVEQEVIENLERVFGPITPVISFARYSFEGTTPPHWAHSDRNIAEFLALIYLSEDNGGFGTACVKHKALGLEVHPRTEFEKQTLISHANKKDEWDITFVCPSKFNRLLVLNADLVHAAMGEYGSTKYDGRLVISVFFNVGRQ